MNTAHKTNKLANRMRRLQRRVANLRSEVKEIEMVSSDLKEHSQQVPSTLEERKKLCRRLEHFYQSREKEIRSMLLS